jgi:predicted nuclease of restriction endonuclease-like (RecB) superfamily
MARRKKALAELPAGNGDYAVFLSHLSGLLDQARRASARAINGILTATYWEMGRRIVEFEQGGQARAAYGEGLLQRLAQDLTAKHGRGFSERNLRQMRAFYLGWAIRQTPSAKLEAQAATGEESSGLDVLPAQVDVLALAAAFPLPWSHYVRLLSVQNLLARRFYEAEALRGGWSIRQLDRQVATQFYERTALSRQKAAMLRKGQLASPGDAVTAEEEVKDPYLLEFLGLKDEYSETHLEEAIIRHLETFLLELGDDFAFVGRQRRLRIDNTWHIVDLIFFHRRLRALLLIDLKVGPFTHADAGQMNLYVGYARENWMREGENLPVGLVLCAEKGHDVARYALDGLHSRVLAASYRTVLPDEGRLIEEIDKTRRMLELRQPS